MFKKLIVVDVQDCFVVNEESRRIYDLCSLFVKEMQDFYDEILYFYDSSTLSLEQHKAYRKDLQREFPAVRLWPHSDLALKAMFGHSGNEYTVIGFDNALTLTTIVSLLNNNGCRFTVLEEAFFSPYFTAEENTIRRMCLPYSTSHWNTEVNPIEILIQRQTQVLIDDIFNNSAEYSYIASTAVGDKPDGKITEDFELPEKVITYLDSMTAIFKQFVDPICNVSLQTRFGGDLIRVAAYINNSNDLSTVSYKGVTTWRWGSDALPALLRAGADMLCGIIRTENILNFGTSCNVEDYVDNLVVWSEAVMKYCNKCSDCLNKPVLQAPQNGAYLQLLCSCQKSTEMAKCYEGRYALQEAIRDWNSVHKGKAVEL